MPFYTMKLIQVLYIVIFYNYPVFSLNFNNNECTNLYDYPVWFISKNCYYNPNVDTLTPNIIMNKGYGLKTYEILTKDGYYLTLFRILPKNGSKLKGKPIYLMHGIATNNAIFVNTNNQSLGFNLMDAGYDVWLGTERGTRYSRKHIHYKITDQNFWKFNLDDLVKYDITELLNFIYKLTKQRILYIGHSQGTTLSLFYASDNPKARKRLKGIINLASVYDFNHNKLLQQLIKYQNILEYCLNKLNIKGLFYQENIINPAIINICKFIPYQCATFFSYFYGSTSPNLRPEDLPLILANFPGGFSIYQLFQYLQFGRDKYFHKYDYGKNKNLEIYFQEKPPKYNLNNIKIPVFMFYGDHDILATESDAKNIYSQLGSKIKNYTNIKEFKISHIEFYTGCCFQNVVNKPIMEIIKDVFQ